MSNQQYQLAEQLGKLLQKKKWHLALAESCTGGGLAQAVTAVPHASSWFDRGFVTYTNESKMELLGVKPETLKKYGAVSAHTAQEMAIGTIKNSHADISMSVTGIAGPTGGSPQKPVGTVWFGFARKSGEVSTCLQNFTGTRQEIQAASVRFALEFLIETIDQPL